MARILLSIFAALAVLVTPARAHDTTPTAEQGLIRVMIEALAPSTQGDWAYRWDAVSIRVSRFMHWHLYGPEPTDRAPDGITRRNGWIDGAGWDVGVSAFGVDDRVTELSFEVHDAFALTLIEALRAEGVEVSFSSEDESTSQYVITPPGRDSGLLTTQRVCTSPHSAAAQRCHEVLTLAFEMP